VNDGSDASWEEGGRDERPPCHSGTLWHCYIAGWAVLCVASLVVWARVSPAASTLLAAAGHTAWLGAYIEINHRRRMREIRAIEARIDAQLRRQTGELGNDR
jgi:CHASE2 domain-containing sensor protein